LKQWNPDVYECPNCKDEVYSKSPGHFAACRCYRNEEHNTGGFVDQTEYYIRVGGSLKYKRKLHNDS
jgi:hypothetical protein